jgi:hypothetical protein
VVESQLLILTTATTQKQLANSKKESIVKGEDGSRSKVVRDKKCFAIDTNSTPPLQHNSTNDHDDCHKYHRLNSARNINYKSASSEGRKLPREILLSLSMILLFAFIFLLTFCPCSGIFSLFYKLKSQWIFNLKKLRSINQSQSIMQNRKASIHFPHSLTTCLRKFQILC